MNGPRRAVGVDVRTGLKIEVTFEEGAADTGVRVTLDFGCLTAPVKGKSQRSRGKKSRRLKDSFFK